METAFPKWYKNWMFRGGSPLVVLQNIGISTGSRRFKPDSYVLSFSHITSCLKFLPCSLVIEMLVYSF